MDDYLAILSVGSAMKGITDRYRVPREMLAFLICTVSASASGITNDDYAKTALPLQAVPFVLSAAAYLAAGFLMQ